MMFQKWNVIIYTSLDTLPVIASRPRRNSREYFNLSLQKKKKNTKANKEEEPRREYYMISTLSTSWLVDSGVSRHMTYNRGALTSYRKKKFTTQVELGDDSTYKIEGVGSTSLQLDLGTVLHIDDVLYVLGLKKNLLPVVGLEDKGYRVLFMDKKSFYGQRMKI